LRFPGRIDPSWVDVDARQLIGEITGNPVTVINDTDAAGIAEMHYGSGKKQDGFVVVLTVGTGIGSSLFMNGMLIPNTELGAIPIKANSIEEWASHKTRKEQDLGKKEWAGRLQQMLETYENIFHPDLFILGGQLSRKASKIFPYIKIKTTFKPADFENEASIIGAAMVAVASDNKEKVFYR
jgi:polyphosphate glucokinase